MSGEARPSLHTAHSPRPSAHLSPEESSCSLPGTWLLSRLQKPQVSTRFCFFFFFFYSRCPRDSERALISSLSFTVPLSPRVTSQVTPSRRTPLPLCDPSHQANGGPQPLVSWGSLWFCLQVAGIPREMEPRNFLFFTGGQPWAGGIFVWQDTVPSFLAYV